MKMYDYDVQPVSHATGWVSLGAGDWRNANISAQQVGEGVRALATGDASRLLQSGLSGTTVTFRTAFSPEVTVDVGSLMAGDTGAGAASSGSGATALPMVRPEVEVAVNGSPVASWAPYGKPPGWFWPAALGLAGIGALTTAWTLYRAFGRR